MAGGNSGKKAAAQARADEQARQERVRVGTANVNNMFDTNFNDQFFDARRQAYVDYAKPQLQDQFADAQEKLTFALARGGNLNSSARADMTADLQKRFDLSQQEILDKGLSFATEARNNVEGARTSLINTLSATGDVEGATNAAMTRAQALSQPAAFSPLSSMFGDITAALGTQAAVERADAMAGRGAGRPQIGTFNTGLFAPRGAMQVQK